MPNNSAAFDGFARLILQIASIEIAPASLTRSTTLAGDLALDSISLISLMTLAEEHFGISLAEHTESVANLRTIGDALDLIDALATARA